MSKSQSKTPRTRTSATEAPDLPGTLKATASKPKKQRDEMPQRVADAFNLYVQLGQTRTHKRVAELVGVDSRTVDRWSTDYDWQLRLERRLGEENWQAREAARQEAYRLSRRRLKNAEHLQIAGFGILKRADLSSLTPQEARKLLGPALRYIAEGMRIERREILDALEAADMPLPPKPIRQLSDAELKAYMTELVIGGWVHPHVQDVLMGLYTQS